MVSIVISFLYFQVSNKSHHQNRKLSVKSQAVDDVLEILIKNGGKILFYYTLS